MTKTAAKGSPRKRHPQPLEAVNVHDALLTVRNAGIALGLSEATVFRLIRRGDLEAVRIGARCTRVRAASVRAFAARL